MYARLLAIMLGTALALTASPVQAFVCSRVQDSNGNENGPSLSWFTRTVTYTLYYAGTADIAGDQEFAPLRDSFAVWMGTDPITHNQSPLQECVSPKRTSDMVIEDSGVLSQTDLVGYNALHPEQNENLIIFRDASWPHPGQEKSIIALTTVSYSAQTGQIIDGDIEFNSANFEFSVGDVLVKTDLMNTAVHEFGHVLGLAHSTNADATMAATATTSEISKRTLECDDKNALVFKYPSSGNCGAYYKDATTGNCYCSPPVQSCGYCAPPQPVDVIPKVLTEDSDDGKGGCGCNSGVHGLEGMLMALAALASRWLWSLRRARA